MGNNAKTVIEPEVLPPENRQIKSFMTDLARIHLLAKTIDFSRDPISQMNALKLCSFIAREIGRD